MNYPGIVITVSEGVVTDVFGPDGQDVYIVDYDELDERTGLAAQWDVEPEDFDDWFDDNFGGLPVEATPEGWQVVMDFKDEIRKVALA